jgi:hypothetical protein
LQCLYPVVVHLFSLPDDMWLLLQHPVGFPCLNWLFDCLEKIH